MSAARLKAISEHLQALAPSVLELTDESHLHAGHAGAASGGGHFRLLIVSEQFRGLAVLARHRRVYESLAAMIPQEIHALSIEALTPEQAQR